jgi:peptide deformylase
MPKLEIFTPPAPVLREKTERVTHFGKELQTLIDDMIETMRDSEGVGLAAPQIGQSKQLTVIESVPKYDDNDEEIPNSRTLYVVINPEITWKSRKMVKGVEGCLSIPGYVGEVERPEEIRVKGQDRRGKKVNWRLKGWTARIFQHEIDHLNGILYIDRIVSKDRLWTDEEYEKMMDEKEKRREARELLEQQGRKSLLVK